MKRFLLIILVLLIASSASAEGEFISVNDFNAKYNYAGILTKSGHKITKDNIQFDSGIEKDCFTITFTNTILHVWMKHTGEMNDINEIDVFWNSDGSTESVMDLLYVISELALTTGVISKVSETNDFISKLDFLNHVEDGFDNKIEENGLIFWCQISSLFGFHLSITKK